MVTKSTTCFGRVSGQPLSEYACAEEAHEAAELAEREYGRAMTPYRCRRCHAWHLALTDRRTPCEPCEICVGRNGEAKQAYRSERGAMRRAEIVFREHGVRLRVYLCPHTHGWHLTKRL